MSWLHPPTLHGRHIRLEPLSPEHGPGLLEILRDDPRVFDYFPPPFAPVEPSAAGLERYIAARLAASESMALAMILTGGPWPGRVVGSSCFFDLRPRHKALEVGATFIHPEFRGSVVNPESKLLMLAHAFDTMGCERVQLKCDARNIHSQRAIEKLGAAREGVLRRHMVMADGFVRDTVMYSIIRAEWPAALQRLQARINRS